MNSKVCKLIRVFCKRYNKDYTQFKNYLNKIDRSKQSNVIKRLKQEKLTELKRNE